MDEDPLPRQLFDCTPAQVHVVKEDGRPACVKQINLKQGTGIYWCICGSARVSRDILGSRHMTYAYNAQGSLRAAPWPRLVLAQPVKMYLADTAIKAFKHIADGDFIVSKDPVSFVRAVAFFLEAATPAVLVGA
eukprot:36027-Chlamydomonas_euryale.AAC.1